MRKLEHDKRDGLYEFTVKDLAEILENRDPNRNLNEAVAAGYARTMPWEPNGEPLVFRGDRLINGQHRCRAAILLGVPLKIYVVYLSDKAKAAFDTMDQGMKRTPGQIMAIAGYKNSRAIAAGMTWVNMYERGWSSVGGNTKMTAREIRSEIAKRPEMVESADVSGKYQKLKFLNPSVIVAAHYLMSKVDPEKATKFFENVMEGESLAKSNPAFTLRNRLISEMSNNRKSLSPVAKFAFCVYAWNAYYRQRQLSILRWNSTDDFPRIEGLR